MSTSPFIFVSHILPGQHVREYLEATASGEDDALQLMIKQYIPQQIQGLDKAMSP